MDNGYQILDLYRQAAGLTWDRLLDEMGMRNQIAMATIRKLALQSNRKPRMLIARRLNGWIDRNRARMNAVIAIGATECGATNTTAGGLK